MGDEEFESWLNQYTSDQVTSLRKLRELVIANTEGLVETVNQEEWLNNYIFYSVGSTMVYAIGVKKNSKISLHMMPLYGSKSLQDRHQSALAPFMSGKSCIDFQEFSQLPISNLTHIFDRGTMSMLAAVEATKATKKK